MLQIIAGKFFSSTKLYETLHRRIFYTNYRTFHPQEFGTSIGKLLTSNAWQGLATMTCEMIERLEAERNGRPEVLISTGGNELINDFAAVVSFSLNVTCTPDPDLTRRLTLSTHPALGISVLPQKFIKRMFDSEVPTQDGDEKSLADFVAELIALDRRKFEGAMKAVRRYITGAHRIADDINLAYALFVMSMESLAQEFDAHIPEWMDYEQGKRIVIDRALEGAPNTVVHKVRQAILKNEHAALARRFRDFTIAHVAPSFFRDEASQVQGPVSRPNLSLALERAYRIRSRYVHTLEEIPRVLTSPHDFSEVVDTERRPTLTFGGIARLARHVITQFIARGPKVEHEHFNYRAALPNIMHVRFAPQVWIRNPEGLNPDTAPAFLNGFWSKSRLSFPEHPMPNFPTYVLYWKRLSSSCRD